MNYLYYIIILILLVNFYFLLLLYRQNKHRDTNRKVGPKVVVLGGGTGQSMLLRGLKQFTDNITAVVTVADDGGGSGILREEMKMLPPGDIRNCIIALSQAEPDMQKIMQYRFTEGSLKGQSFGNLFIAALTGCYQSFDIAVTKISHILAVKGKVLPVTLEQVDLEATLMNNVKILGESKIAEGVAEHKSKIASICLVPQQVKTSEEVIVAIQQADIIVLGPGSLYTSIIPNLLTDTISSTIASAKAEKVYIANIMTQDGETDNMTIVEHINALLSHSKQKKLIDWVIINNEKVPLHLLEKYAKYNSRALYLDAVQREMIMSFHIHIIEEQLLSFNDTFIRHDEIKLARTVLDILKH